MSLKKTLLVWSIAWLCGISFLHAWLNLGVFHKSALAGGPRQFRVGFLPVTCHLTCPVNHFIEKNLNGNGSFEPIRFNGWPELKEAFLSKYTDATFILAPMAMKLREEGVPIKIVYLGHRDGSAMMVNKDSSIFRIEDLRGKKVAVPNRYTVYVFPRLASEYKEYSPLVMGAYHDSAYPVSLEVFEISPGGIRAIGVFEDDD